VLSSANEQCSFDIAETKNNGKHQENSGQLAVVSDLESLAAQDSRQK